MQNPIGRGPSLFGQRVQSGNMGGRGAFNQSTVRFGGRGRGTWSGKTGNIDYSGAKTVSENTLRDYEDRERWAAKFSELHDNQASSDCAIQIGGVSIPAHKSILMAHSPIFQAMFTNPLAEEFQSGTIKITDYKEPEPMRALVRYCYQGRLDTETMDGEWAVETFKLADRYCIKELKFILERHFIEKRLSAKNVVALGVLADAHSAPKLKEACIKLIASKGSAVFEIAEWQELSDGELIAEVFQLAEKYSITGLRTQLEEHFIRKRLSIENVVSMAILADAHSAEKLKEGCIKLIAKEGKTVYESTEWSELKKAKPEFTTDLAEGASTVLAERVATMLAEKGNASCYACGLSGHIASDCPHPHFPR